MKIALTLWYLFFKVGITSFGGGYGMMSMIMDEGNRLVGLTTSQFADMTALDLICSGPVAVNGATYVGFLKGGYIGSIAATLGVILPSILVCSIVLIFLERFYKSKIVQGLFKGITPACGGLMIFTTVVLIKSVFFHAESYADVLKTPYNSTMIGMIALCIAAVIADLKFKVSPIYLTLFGALIGIIFFR